MKPTEETTTTRDLGVLLTDEAPYLENIGLMLTYRCQVACSHCIVSAGPHRKEEVSLEDGCDWVSQIAAYRSGHIKSIGLTGGDPFCCFDKLKKIVQRASGLGLLVSAVTNASWAKSVEEAVSLLKDLSALSTIAYSVDVYHQRIIPFERVRNAILAAQELGLNCVVKMSSENIEAPEDSALLSLLDGLIPREDIHLVSTIRAGRAESEVDFSGHMTSEAPTRLRCGMVGSPVILPGGQIIACCAGLLTLRNQHPLSLGSLREHSLAEILDKSDENCILHTLRLWGPRKLVSLIEQSELRAELPDKYINDDVCDPCRAIMSNPKMVEWLERLAEEPGYRKAVAHGRAHHFNEVGMLCSCLGW